MKTRIADISSTLISAVRGIHADTWIASVCLISLLIASVLPVRTGRSESEVYLCFLIPILASLGFLTILKRKTQFHFNWIDGIALGWYAYAMFRLWFDVAYPAAGFAIRATLMCMLYVAVRILFTGCRISGKCITALLILFSLVEAYLGYSQLISGVSRHHLYPVTGSFLNPGPYSAYLAIGIVSVLAMRKMKDARWVIVLLLGFPLMLTMSRAAFLAVFICLLILYRNRIKGWKQWSTLIFITAICCICLYSVKAGSADGRGIINYIGLQSFSDAPLLGSGIRSFFHRFACKTAEISMQSPITDLSSVDVIDYAFNDLLLVGVEQGIIGLALGGALIIMVMRRLWKENLPLFLAALALLTICVFSYPFVLLPYQIIAVIITAFAATNAGSINTETERFSFFKGILTYLTVIAVIYWVSNICRNEIKLRIEAEKDYRMLAGLRDKAFTKDYYAYLPYMLDNKHFLFDFAKLLIEQGRYNDSNDMLRRGALISNDPMFLVLQGNNYRDMEAYELAEEAYLKAWHTIPNRLYPLYQLMKLHEQTGNREKALSYAKKIINFKEKIKSPAVNDMKKEAIELIEHER